MRQRSKRFSFFVMVIFVLLIASLFLSLSYHSFLKKASLFARVSRKFPIIRTKAAKRATAKYPNPPRCVKVTELTPTAKVCRGLPLRQHH